ncbi:Metallo-hydrolase/oxidoreductase [Schizophyllum commune Loenen D]|nr:Metallo-hydrolase/oxidoreductase [Schizophyllum commune Loenen D]
MDKLESLPSIARLSERVVRVLGQNPGKFTLQGTNTYLIGTANPYILLDTGEGLEEYITVLESALKQDARPANPSKPDVSDIIISHWHHDHVGGLPSVLALLRNLWIERNPSLPFVPPRLHKYPLDAKSGVPSSFSSHLKLPSILASLPIDSYTPSPTGAHLYDLTDGQTLITADGSVTLQVLHTPGHTTDSIALYIAQDGALYTADSVLGQGTAVFEDLSTYLASLRKLLDFCAAGDGAAYTVLYPGHGPVVKDGCQTIETYIKHRLERETQIFAVLQSDGALKGGSTITTGDIVAVIYKDYPKNLWEPAAYSVNLHLRKLEVDGVVRRSGEGEGLEAKWEVIGKQ